MQITNIAASTPSASARYLRYPAPGVSHILKMNVIFNFVFADHGLQPGRSTIGVPPLVT